MTTFAFGALDLEVAPAASTSGAATFVFGGMSVIATAGFATVALYDENNEWLAVLPLADDLQYQCAVSDPGMVSLRLPLDDAATDDAVPGRFVKVFRHGRVQQAAELTGSSVDMAVDGEMWRSWSNLPGVLALLAKGAVWPEYGTDRSYSSTRTFGYMSATNVGLDRVTGWFKSGNWTHPVDPFHFQADTGFRQFKPAGLSFPNPQWIAKRGAYHDEDAGARQWARRQFTTYTDVQYQILVTFDDFGELWLDGERIVDRDPTRTQQWAQLYQIKGKLPAGEHVLAGEMVGQRHKAGPLAMILTLQQLRQNGDVVNGPPIINTHQFWNVSDVPPGFKKADVIRRSLFENQDLYDVGGGFQLLTVGFNATNDSDGVEWQDDPEEHTADVGGDLLSLLADLTEDDWDAGIDPDTFRLLGWVRKGSDKSGTVIIRRGDGDTGSLVSGGVDRQTPKYTVLLIQLADTTWIEVEDAGLVAEWGRIIGTVSAGDTHTESKARRIARGMFREQALAAASFTATIDGLDGPRFGLDFVEGDTIGMEDENGDVQPVRVMSGLVDCTPDGEPPVELELILDAA